MTLRLTKLFIFFYCIVAFLLLFYSYSQIDLGFNLPNIPLLVDVQKFMQHIGYFDRPLSTLFYLGLVILLFTYYVFFLFLVKKKILNNRTFWILLIVVSLCLSASYNAFSYDFFNYIFDAKILSYYHVNPYAHKALDFPNDPMLGFMHWTHRTYPYGPVWLALTAPLYSLGFSNFLPTQLLFKLLITGSFLGTVYYIGEILKKVNPKYALLGMVFFGFNPLVLIESLVSSHNDIVMMFFVILSIYFLIEKRTVFSLVLMALSIGTKFATAVLLPIYFYQMLMQRRDKLLPWDRFFLASIVLLFIAMLLVALRTNFQPWYLLYILTFAPFLSHRYYIFIPAFIFSLAGLLNYVPFLLFGNWNSPIPEILLTVNIGAIVLSFLVCILFWYFKARVPRLSL